MMKLACPTLAHLHAAPIRRATTHARQQPHIAALRRPLARPAPRQHLPMHPAARPLKFVSPATALLHEPHARAMKVVDFVLLV